MARASFLFLFVVFSLISVCLAHCQVPCGIYDDEARVNKLLEDTSTIRKAIMELSSLHELEKQTITQANQFVRWVNTKEKHANDMISVLSDYFLVQRVAEGDVEFLQQVHKAMKLAMKAKQSVDLAVANQLHDAIHIIGDRYHMFEDVHIE